MSEREEEEGLVKMAFSAAKKARSAHLSQLSDGPGEPERVLRLYAEAQWAEMRAALSVYRTHDPLLREMREALAELPDGPWKVWTSCSFRRITGPDGRDGSVLHALNHRSDGHPDLSMSERQLSALCRIVNSLRAALAEHQP